MTGLTLHNLFVQRLMEKQNMTLNNFTFPLKFTSKIYCRDLTPQEAKDDQQELKILINKLNKDHSRKIKQNKRKR